jgi:hypothetical protein
MKRRLVSFTALVIAFRAAAVFAQDPALAQAAVYRIRMSIADDLGEVAGSLDVQYTNRERAPIGSIVFFLFPNLTPGSLEIREARVAGRRVLPEYRQKRSVLVVRLPAPLAAGVKVSIGLDYSVSVPAGSDGTYGLLSHGEGYLSLAFAYPMIPSRGAWNHPLPVAYGDFLTNDASSYFAQVFVPAGYEIAAPGTVTRRKAPGGRTDVSISLAPARDLYMAVARGWVRSERRENGVTVASYAARDAGDSSKLVISTALSALACFGRRFGPYPYDALTFVSLPFDAYGCEFSGIVLESARLHDPAFVDRGVPSLILLESTTAHEAAHQWFYGIVGSDQLLKPWLDEGIAQYATLLYYRDRCGETGARSTRRRSAAPSCTAGPRSSSRRCPTAWAPRPSTGSCASTAGDSGGR